MISLTEQQIAEIAGNLECGIRCLYNINTGIIKTILKNNSRHEAMILLEVESGQEESRQNYIEFENMNSYALNKIMNLFIETVSNNLVKERLSNALRRPKPFQHFNDAIDNSGEYRKIWRDFKTKYYINWVKDQIDRTNKTLV